MSRPKHDSIFLKYKLCIDRRPPFIQKPPASPFFTRARGPHEGRGRTSRARGARKDAEHFARRSDSDLRGAVCDVRGHVRVHVLSPAQAAQGGGADAGHAEALRRHAVLDQRAARPELCGPHVSQRAEHQVRRLGRRR
eukprot:scaffold3330_cov398-Pinguiococcus_pyrenoidosus.AAC.2